MKKIRVGVVGPKDSVNLILDLSQDFQEQMTMIPFCYQQTDDVIKIIQNEQDVDVWLFSGQVPYSIANEHGIRKQAFFPFLNGSSLVKSLFEIGYRDQKELKRITFDTISREDIHEMFRELNLSYKDIHVLPYSGYKPIDELVSFHERLFKAGQVDMCVTCVRSVYEELKGLGVPVYRITPTRISIRQTLHRVIQQGKTIHFQRSQIAILLIQIQNHIPQSTSEEVNSYDTHRLNLKLQEVVLDYTEKISGTFVFQGNGRFIIFSTRGSLESNQDYHPTSLLENIYLITDLPTNIGVGFGNTAWHAEQNAQLALLHARNDSQFSAFRVDENGLIEGPLEKPDSIQFHYKTVRRELSERLRESGITVKALNKILAVQKKTGKDSVTSVDVAKWLKMSTRNARRILSILERYELAEIVGEESPPTKGRPRKIYRIRVDLFQ